jgi:hypothetical protein
MSACGGKSGHDELMSTRPRSSSFDDDAAVVVDQIFGPSWRGSLIFWKKPQQLVLGAKPGEGGF